MKKYVCSDWEFDVIQHALIRLEKEWEKIDKDSPGMKNLHELQKTLLQVDKIEFRMKKS
jgi:hypothetical protein